eukprot:TRINITY_DN26693_c0_g3_i1.p1 TRINITY_DN26693_c0_g3~~TRINITY_DN26693_c0_g3_i1.p1  ORF type:complete len:792 (+),score=67.48 TRINITY_DN26693_c0_g3_i1:83-2458(+)
MAAAPVVAVSTADQGFGHARSYVSPRRRRRMIPDREKYGTAPVSSPSADYVADVGRFCDSERPMPCESSLLAHLPLQSAPGRSEGCGYMRLPTDDNDNVVPSTNGLDDSPTRAAWRVSLCDIVDSWQFNATSVLAICSNAVLIGLETDHPEVAYWTHIEGVFLVWFVLEFVLRLVSLGPKTFFCGVEADLRRSRRLSKTCAQLRGETGQRQGDVFWNIFDLVILTMGVFGALSEAISDNNGHSNTENATVFRILRLARALRILRVVRVLRFLKQLYLLAYGFIEGAMAVFWVAILTGVVIYLCAIVLVRAYSRHPDGDAHQEFMAKLFPSVGRAMWTLFSILASPTLSLYDGIIFEFPGFLCFVVVFVLFGSFGISGLLTGVISESIIDKNSARIEEQRTERERKRRLIQALAKETFEQIDICKSGALRKQDFVMEKPAIERVFAVAGLQFTENDYEHLWEIMDYDDSGLIEKDGFVHYIMEMCDDVRPMSIMELHSQLSKLQANVTRLLDKTDKIQQGVGDTLLRDRLDRKQRALHFENMAQLEPYESLGVIDRRDPQDVHNVSDTPWANKRAREVSHSCVGDASSMVVSEQSELSPTPEAVAEHAECNEPRQHSLASRSIDAACASGIASDLQTTTVVDLPRPADQILEDIRQCTQKLTALQNELVEACSSYEVMPGLVQPTQHDGTPALDLKDSHSHDGANLQAAEEQNSASCREDDCCKSDRCAMAQADRAAASQGRDKVEGGSKVLQSQYVLVLADLGGILMDLSRQNANVMAERALSSVRVLGQV